MKALIKRFSTIILVVITMFLCKFQDKVVVAPYLEHIGLRARLENGIYIITLSQPGEKATYVHFTADRKVLRKNNISPITLDNRLDINGCPMEDMMVKYGEPHTDIGSGFYIPAYITDDALLVSFRLDDDCVSNVCVEDLLAMDRGTCTG